MNTPYRDRLARAQEAVRGAEAVLIGGGAGLSASAGLEYSGPRFLDNFADFIARYQLTDMYTSAFYAFPTPEERWAYLARHIHINRYGAEIGEPYTDLLEVTRGKDSFVLTTNVDAQFFKAGFERVFATQGDYGRFQCAVACHDRLYDNEAIVGEMIAQQRDCHIPSALVPMCPVCGGPLAPHLRVDRHFVQDEAWYEAQERYRRFVEGAVDRRLVVLELGVGYNTPGIIKHPFEDITAAAARGTLIRVNRDHPEVSPRNRDKTIAFDEDLAEIVAQLVAPR